MRKLLNTMLVRQCFADLLRTEPLRGSHCIVLQCGAVPAAGGRRRHNMRLICRFVQNLESPCRGCACRRSCATTVASKMATTRWWAWRPPRTRRYQKGKFRGR